MGKCNHYNYDSWIWKRKSGREYACHLALFCFSVKNDPIPHPPRIPLTENHPRVFQLPQNHAHRRRRNAQFILQLLPRDRSFTPYKLKRFLLTVCPLPVL